MTNREKIQYLKQYISISNEFEEIYDSFLKCKSKMCQLQAQTLTDMPTVHKLGDKIGGAIANIEWLEGIVDERLAKLEQLRTEIENSIGRIEDSLQRRVLYLRYIDGYSWEHIAVKINYAWAQTHRIHSDALRNINI